MSRGRNAAIDNAVGDIVCFIDDDELVGVNWPGGLIDVMTRTGAALTGGPVDTTFALAPPSWVVDGGFFNRDNPRKTPWSTGYEPETSPSTLI
ncbi:MAG: glycosyltransferase [Acidimicrobiales bacterium]